MSPYSMARRQAEQVPTWSLPAGSAESRADRPRGIGGDGLARLQRGARRQRLTATDPFLGELPDLRPRIHPRRQEDEPPVPGARR